MFHLPKSFFRSLLLALCAVTTPALATTVVEFYNTNLDNYFITADAGEAVAIDNGSAGLGWSRTGNSFNSGGTTSVCRFYGSQSPGPNSHFYTLAGSECDGLKQLQASTPATQKRWNFESLDFVSTPASNGTCPSGTTPVYRAYNNGFSRGVDSNHRITSSQTAIQEVVSRGWSNEGVVMCAPSGTGTGGTTGGTSTYQSAYNACYNGTPALYTSTYCSAYANAIVAGSTPAAANLAGAVAANSNVGNIGMGGTITATGTPTPTSMSGSMAWTVGNQYSGAQINYKFYDFANSLVWPSSSSSYVSNYSDTRTANLNCISGANICIGASSGSLSWGVGLAGNSSCTTCCYSCDGGTHSYTFGGSSSSTPGIYYWANWTCSGPQCASVMGAYTGSTGLFCTVNDCNAWRRIYNSSSSCSTAAIYTQRSAVGQYSNGVCAQSGVDF